MNRDDIYKLLNNNNFNPKIIVDCGACCGEWSSMIRQIYQNSLIIGIDPNKWCGDGLINGTDISEYVLLSEEDDKEYTFYRKKEYKCTGDSIFKENTQHYQIHNTIEDKLKSVTLNTILKNHNLDHIDLLKLDTQGSEILIMKGLGDKLNDIEFIEIECSLVEYNLGGCSIYDIIDFLKANFTIYDISELHRHNNYYLCQIDLIFQNKKSNITKLM